MAIEKLLIIRFSSIGDIVLTTPVLRALKTQWPETQIHYLVKKQYAPVLAANPYIDRLHLYDHNFRELIPQLKSEGFTRIIDLHRNYRSSFVKQHFRIPSYSFPKINIRKWLAVKLKWNVLPDIHIVDRYFRAVRSLGIVNDRLGLDYFIHPGEQIIRDMLPESHRKGYIAVVTGARHHTKIFPAEKVSEVMHKLGKPAILLGGAEDKKTGEMIASTHPELILNYCGTISLNQSASLVRDSEAVLTNDTGLMHIAAAFGKPIVSVWGNTVPEFGMYPYYPAEKRPESMMAQVKNLSCRPCSKIGYNQCPKKHFRCMNDIDTAPIAEFLAKQFNGIE
jgi:ADP-heptose:LPS heptosyltransferase